MIQRSRKWGAKLVSFMTIALAIPMMITVYTAFAVDDSIVVNSVDLTLLNDADANNFADVGDTIRIEADIDNVDNVANADCTTALPTVVVDLQAYGGGASEALSVQTCNNGVSDIWRLDFVVVDADVDGIDVAANDASSAVTVSASDTDEAVGGVNTDPTTATSNNLGDGVIDTVATNGVDTIAPFFQSIDLNVDASACTGNAGVCIVGDNVVFTWDASNDPENADVVTAQVNTVDFGGVGLTSMLDDGLNGDGAAADGVYGLSFSVLADTDDLNNVGVLFRAVDDAGNFSAIANGTPVDVDNEVPSVTPADLIADESVCTGLGGGCLVGDIITFSFDSSAEPEAPVVVTADLTNFGGGVAQTLYDDGSNGDLVVADGVFTFDYTVPGGAPNGTFTFDVTAEDDAGNSTTNSSTDDATINDAPAQVSGVNSPGKTNTSVRVAWNPVSNTNFDHYEVYYRSTASVDNSNGILWGVANDGDLSQNTTSETDIIGLSSGQEYFFVVYSVSPGGTYSVVSNEISVVTGSTSTSSGGGGGGGGGSSFILNSSSSTGSTNETSTSEDTQEENSTSTEEADTLSTLNPIVSAPFEDIIGHWSETYVESLRLEGIVSGKTIGEFEPDANVTRAEFLKMVMGAFGYAPVSSGSEDFSDVSEGEWYWGYVVKANDLGFVTGYDDGTFKPNATISRVEALTIVIRVSGLDYNQEVTNVFPDTDRFAWYAQVLSFAVEKDVIDGYANGDFGPADNLTRGQAAKIIVLTNMLWFEIN